MTQIFNYIDIHTHNKACKPDVLSVYNILVNENILTVRHKFNSAGIHPWYIDKYPEDVYFNIFNRYFSNYNIIAVGETGLDKLKPDIDLQTKYFVKQMLFAVDKQLPLIIHCVKAFDETLLLLDKYNFTLPVIFHRYGADSRTTEMLSERGNIYFSFGHEVTGNINKAVKALTTVGADKIFAETDDSNIPIEHIYSKIAEIKNISPQSLQNIINSNFNRVFNGY